LHQLLTAARSRPTGTPPTLKHACADDGGRSRRELVEVVLDVGRGREGGRRARGGGALLWWRVGGVGGGWWVGRCRVGEARRPRGERVLVKFALGDSVVQAAGARELLEALQGRCEVGWWLAAQ